MERVCQKIKVEKLLRKILNVSLWPLFVCAFPSTHTHEHKFNMYIKLTNKQINTCQKQIKWIVTNESVNFCKAKKTIK